LSHACQECVDVARADQDGVVAELVGAFRREGQGQRRHPTPNDHQATGPGPDTPPADLEHAGAGGNSQRPSESALWLSDEEFPRFFAAFGEFLAPYLANPETPERTRRLISTIVIPD
jgi:hypothetical protein